MKNKIKVKKRHNGLEYYCPQNIERVVKAAGLLDKEARVLSLKVSEWIYQQDIKIITSLQIRDKVLEELKKVSQYSAGLFAWYEKNKEKQHKNLS